MNTDQVRISCKYLSIHLYSKLLLQKTFSSNETSTFRRFLSHTLVSQVSFLGIWVSPAILTSTRRIFTHRLLSLPKSLTVR